MKDQEFTVDYDDIYSEYELDTPNKAEIIWFSIIKHDWYKLIANKRTAKVIDILSLSESIED